MRFIKLSILTALVILLFAFSPSIASAEENIPTSSEVDINSDDPGGGGGYYPGTNVRVQAGDILYSSKGTDTYLVGHAGIVSPSGTVIHITKGGGMREDSLSTYLSTFDVQVWKPKNFSSGQAAASFAKNTLYNLNYNAEYTIFTTLTGPLDKQYCTKLVWQSYYYGAGINLGDIEFTKTTVPPSWLLDRNYLTLVARI